MASEKLYRNTVTLCHLKRTNFYLENKASASFIQIGSTASFNPFLTAWLCRYCIFSDSSVVSLKSSPWPKYPKYGTVFPKKCFCTIMLDKET